MKSKIALSVAIVLLIILAGATFAWWTWSSSTNTNVVFNVAGVTSFEGKLENIANMSGKNLIPRSAKPTSESDTTGIFQEFKASATMPAYMNVYLKLNTFPTGLKHKSLVWELYEDSTKVGNDTFESATQGNVITLASNRAINTTAKTYKLYIWIDGQQANPSSMMNQTYSFALYATATDQPPS